VILTAILHAGPVEFLYYWLHRALHHHYLYSRYHSHHHSSIVTEPITCMNFFQYTLIWNALSSKLLQNLVLLCQNNTKFLFCLTAVAHPFAEHLSYFTLFAIPMLTTLFTKKSSVAALYGYIFYIDFMNNMGHCNFEFFPKKLLSYFPILKYLSYTPS